MVHVFKFYFSKGDCEKLKSLYIHDLSNNKPVKIDALEAIGVTLGDDRELLESALMYWDASLDERYN